MSDKLTHFDADGRVNMVDVSGKKTTNRLAVAVGQVRMKSSTLELVQGGKPKKGDVVTISEIAGVMATKRTADLIPLCHPLPITGAKVSITIDEKLPGLSVTARVKTTGQTGVEMEALTAVSVACLTIYDMLKAVDKGMVIENIELLEKSGGKSGTYYKDPHRPQDS
ncbi:MAG: cyclic pyranopterin monophosphate synthase MoaC [Acidimicrobiales bacterium]|nr:cyclic pyranopterin monophosphate synthase MoaC [Hyphomonadaceae bacterium]RZV41442.1 MAG: cyclic pyranopterin monophosphate synthase MoaC [Acidimicrobiales bacterium]